MSFFERCNCRYTHDADYAEVLEKCPPGPIGTSLEQVKDLLEKHGVHTCGFSGATTGKLKQLRYPAIMHLNSNSGTGHFLVIVGWKRERQAFHVYSPPSYYGYMSEKEIGDGLTGLGLAVSDRPLPPVEDMLSQDNSLWPSLAGLLFCIILFAWVAVGRRFSWKAESRTKTQKASCG